MTVGVSHTFGGNVVVVDMQDGRRWDFTPDMAVAAAEQLETLAARFSSADGGIVYAQARLDALDDRALRFSGYVEDHIAMAADLRGHADRARQKLTANDDGALA